jgi:hypothetical protein
VRDRLWVARCAKQPVHAWSADGAEECREIHADDQWLAGVRRCKRVYVTSGDKAVNAAVHRKPAEHLVQEQSLQPAEPGFRRLDEPVR